MKNFSATKLTVALVVCVLAPCARAQTQGVKDEAVRERRATTTTADESKGEPESKTDAAKGEHASKGVQTNKTEPASPLSQSPASSASAEVKDAAKGGGADELRAQMAS